MYECTKLRQKVENQKTNNSPDAVSCLKKILNFELMPQTAWSCRLHYEPMHHLRAICKQCSTGYSGSS